jgi:hypothetical protein
MAMTPKFPLCLALGLSGILFVTFATAQSSGLANENKLQWGEAVGRFQMAAALDESNTVIHCWIRNAWTNAILYNDFLFGYVENVSLQFRQGTNWVVVNAGVFPGQPEARGAIPTDTKVSWLQPGEIITNTWERRDTMMRLPYRQQSWNYARESSLLGITERDTFALDLINTRWPTNILQEGTCEVRVKQDFHCTSPEDEYPYLHDPRLTLFSPVLKLERK